MAADLLTPSVTIMPAKRSFTFKGIHLPDPDQSMQPMQVIEFYSTAYPELTTGFIKNQNLVGDGIEYEIGFNVGNKG